MRSLKLLLSKYTTLFICCFLLVGALNAQDAGFFQQQKVAAINSQDNDLFGGQISMLGDTLVLASAKGYNSGSGAVSFLREDGSGNWKEFFTIEGNPDNGTSFGSQVAIVEDFAFVAQSSDDNSGEVRVYERGTSSNSWNFLKVIKASEPAASNFFGFEIIAKGDFLFVADQKSSVFIYKKDQGGTNNWGLIKTITGQADAHFGAAMDFDSETLLIGAPLHDGQYTNEGNAFVYELNDAGTDFDLVSEDLIDINSRNTTDGNFGASVSIEDTRMLIASPGEKSLQGFAQRYEGGNCYVMDESSSGANNWGYSGYVDIPIFEDEPRTINKVVLRNDNIFINFINRGLDCQPSAGVIYWFKLTKGWLFDSFDFFQLLKQDEPSAYAHFGTDFAFNGGNDLVVGSNAFETNETSVSGDLIFFGKQAFVSEPMKTFETYDATYADLISPSSVQLFASPEFTDFSDESGFVLSSTNTNPTLCDDVHILPSEATEFTLTVSGLTPATEYYFRPYNISSTGESYGLVESFRTNPIDSKLIFEELVDNLEGVPISTGAAIVASNDQYIFTEITSDGSKSIATIENQSGGLSIVQNKPFSALGIKNSDIINTLEVSDDGKYLYAGIDNINTVISFNIEGTTGELTVLETLTTNANDYQGNVITGIEDPVEIVASSDNKHLYVLSRYSSDNSETYVSAFAIDQTSGELAFVDKFITGADLANIFLLGQSIDIKPDGSELLVSTGEVEAGRNGLIRFARNSTTGALTFVKAYEDFMLDGNNIGEPSFKIRYSKDGSRAYGIGTFGDFMVFDVNSTSIAVTQNINFSPQKASTLAVGAEEQVYVKMISDDFADRQLEAIEVFEYDESSNELQLYESKRDVIVDVFGEPQNIIEASSLITDNSGEFLYSTGNNSFNQFSTISPGAFDFSFGFEAYYFEENQSAGTATGEFFSYNPENAFYELVSGAGDDDNGSFSISNGQLIIDEVADFEAKNSYSVRVKAETEDGEILEEVFIIEVNDVNEAPTSISITPDQIASDFDQALLGTLSAEDPEGDTNIFFELISGFPDNENLTIDGNEVYTLDGFSIAGKDQLSLQIRATDQGGDGGLSYEQSVIIDIVIVDSDEDGVADSEDNCPETANPEQEDSDFDGVGDVCDEIDNCDFNIFNEDVTICEGQSTILDAGSGFTSYLWSTGSTTQSIVADTAGLYTVTVTTDQGCEDTDSVRVNVLGSNSVSLGADLTLCEGEETTLDAGEGYTSYLWSTGETTQSINITESGEYSVIVQMGTLCEATDTVNVFFNDINIDLGEDIIKCEAEEVKISAGADFASYQWSTGETTSEITVGNPGQYVVTVTNVDGCTATDSISVTIGNMPIVDLGEDLETCFSEPIVLDAGEGFSSYDWSTGESTQQIEIEEAGEYSVEITNSEGCTASDTIEVREKDIEEAELTSYGFVLTASEGTAYQWYLDGELLPDSTQSIIARKMGLYEVAVMSEAGCISFSEEITVLVTAEKESPMEDSRVFPNPVKNEISIFIPQEYDEKVGISVYSTTGELIEVIENSTSTKLDVSNWKPGLYLILLRFKSFEKSFKVLKK